jgi:predicted sugar kinase
MSSWGVATALGTAKLASTLRTLSLSKGGFVVDSGMSGRFG